VPHLVSALVEKIIAMTESDGTISESLWARKESRHLLIELISAEAELISDASQRKLALWQIVTDPRKNGTEPEHKPKLASNENVVDDKKSQIQKPEVLDDDAKKSKKRPLKKVKKDLANKTK
jgi:hypothetical protein